MTYRDPRNTLPLNWAFYRCPWPECDTDTEQEPTITALLRTREGKQRAIWACPDHLPYLVEAECYSLRLAPPPDL